MRLSTDIHSLFVLLLSLFTLASTFLAIYTVSNAIRLRNIRISWKSGKLRGYPLFSALFLGFSAAVAAVVVYTGLEHYYIIMGCYLWLGVCWFTSSYFSSKSYITDHGIVKNINDPSQTIAWHQINDYVEKPSTQGSDYIFIYHQNSLNRVHQKMIRLELSVPDKKIGKFDKIVALKIGRILTPVMDSSHDFKSFE